MARHKIMLDSGRFLGLQRFPTTVSLCRVRLSSHAVNMPYVAINAACMWKHVASDFSCTCFSTGNLHSIPNAYFQKGLIQFETSYLTMMRKKKPFMLPIVILFVSLALCVHPIDTAKANPISIPTVPSIQIGYPSSAFSDWLNVTLEYVNSTIELQTTVNLPIDSPMLNGISYRLDGAEPVNLTDLTVATLQDYGPTKMDYKKYSVNVQLENLSEGAHTVEASANDMSDSIAFTVNSYYHITALSIQSPNNQIYTSDTVPLTFTYTGDITNAHYYLYSGGQLIGEKPLSGDTTIDNLPQGSYDLYLYVTTQYGQDAKTIHFSIISTVTIIGATALLAITLLSLLVYKKFKKKNTTLNPSS